MTVVGEAFIVIKPDTDDFAKDVQRQTTDIADRASKAFTRGFDPPDPFSRIPLEAERVGSQAADAFTDGFRLDANGRVRDQFGRFIPAAEQAAGRAADNMEAKIGGRNILRRAIDRIRGGDGDALGDSVAHAASRAEGKVSGAFGGLAKKAAFAFGAAFAGQQVVSFLGGTLTAASDLNEVVSKTGVIFGDQAGKVASFAKTAATTLGQSQQAALEAASTFGTLAKAGGLSGDRAAEFSVNLTKLSADLASFSNTSPEDAALALGAALRGEAEPIRRYGVLLDEASLKAIALQKGLISANVDQEKLALAQEKVRRAQQKASDALAKYGEDSEEARRATFDLEQAQGNVAKMLEGKVPASLDQATKVQAAYLAILDQTKDAQGDFARTSGGAANQQRILAAQVTDLKAKIGTSLLPAFASTLKFINDKVLPGLSRFSTAAAETLGPIIDKAKVFGKAFVDAFSGKEVSGDGAAGTFARLGANLRKVFDFIADVAPKVIPPLVAGFGFVIDILSRVAEVLIRDVIPAVSRFVQSEVVPFVRDKVIPAVKAFVEFLQRNVPPAVERANAIISRIVEVLRPVVAFIADKVVPVIRDMVDKAQKFIGDLVAGIQERSDKIVRAFRNVKEFVEGYVKAVATVIGVVLTPVVIFFRSWGDEILGVISAVWEQIKNIVETAVRIVRDVIDVVLSLLAGDWGDAWNALKDIPAAAFEFILKTIGNWVKAAYNILKGILGGIADLFSTGFDAARKKVGEVLSGLVDDVKGFIGDAVDTILGMPKRLFNLARDLNDLFLDVGKKIIGGILSGLADAGEFIVDIGKQIVNGIIGFINKQVIQRFNRLVEFEVGLPFGAKFRIDPPDIPSIPSLAKGAIARATAGGTLVRVAEANRDEAIVPLPPGLVEGLQRIAEGAVGGAPLQVTQIINEQPTPRLTAIESARQLRSAAYRFGRVGG